MKQLSGLDATFLYLETPQMPMHVGALHVFELPAGFKGRFVTALRKHIAARLPEAPVLRRRLWWMPLNMANPAWVDAEPDLRQHIVELPLPPSARHGDGMAELQAAVSRLHAVLLDRSRPLWKFHVFEGLAPGAGGQRRVAMYSQLHHAAVDGQAAVALANAILDPTPQPRAAQAPRAGLPRTFELGMSEMLRGVLGAQAQKVAQIIRELPGTVGTLGGAAGQAIGQSIGRGRVPLLSGKGAGNLTLAPRTPFNASVTEGRAFAAATLPLPEVKALGRAAEATINDIVLWLVATALRRYLAKRHALPRASLVAAVPISLRAKGDTTADNQASMSLVNLGTNIADPRRRLAHVKAASASMKSTMGPLKGILPTDFPSLGVPWLLEAATALYGKVKVAERIPQVANVVVSNVPGPPVPLYLAGARMLTNYPTSIVVHGVALNITVQSYDQSLDFGLMADAKAAPDVAALAAALGVALDDLRVLVGSQDADLAAAAAAAAAAGPGLVDRTTRRVRAVVDETIGRAARQVASQFTAQVASGVAAQMAAGVAARARRGVLGGAVGAKDGAHAGPGTTRIAMEAATRAKAGSGAGSKAGSKEGRKAAPEPATKRARKVAGRAAKAPAPVTPATQPPRASSRSRRGGTPGK